MGESAEYKDYFGNYFHLTVNEQGSVTASLDCASQATRHNLEQSEAAAVHAALLQAVTNPHTKQLNVLLDGPSYPANPNEIHLTSMGEDGEGISGILFEQPTPAPMRLGSIEVPVAEAGSLTPSDHPLGKACALKSGELPQRR